MNAGWKENLKENARRIYYEIAGPAIALGLACAAGTTIEWHYAENTLYHWRSHITNGAMMQADSLACRIIELHVIERQEATHLPEFREQWKKEKEKLREYIDDELEDYHDNQNILYRKIGETAMLSLALIGTGIFGLIYGKKNIDEEW
ncbi:MAG: hypothetical protein V1743_02690 [Nanoarchaeota archaeon]